MVQFPERDYCVDEVFLEEVDIAGEKPLALT